MVHEPQVDPGTLAAVSDQSVSLTIEGQRPRFPKALA